MSTPLFRTITDADWSRELRVSRATPNQIRARIASRLPRQITAQSESHNGSQPAMARRFDAFLFTTAGSADREGGGTTRAEAGGGELFSGATPDTKANDAD